MLMFIRELTLVVQVFKGCVCPMAHVHQSHNFPKVLENI